MATTENLYTGDGSTVLFSFTFPYLEEAHIKVSLAGSDTTEYTLANATTVEFNTAPAVGVAIRLYRDSDSDTPEATFFPGSAIRAADLNDNFLQSLYLNQETRRVAQDAVFGGVPDGTIGTAKLATASVTEVKLGAEAVTESKIGTGAVTEVKIGPGAVSNAKLGIAAVTTDRVADSAITQAKIGTNVLTPTVSEINGGPLAGFRNAIINGNFDIWQRGTSRPDRFNGYLTAGASFSQGQYTLTDAQRDIIGYGAKYALACYTGDTASAIQIQNSIEEVRTLAGQQVTVSFWAFVDTGTCAISSSFAQNFGTGGSPSSTVGTSLTLSATTVTTTPTKITATVTLPSISGKTLGSNGDDYLGFLIQKPAGVATTLCITQVQVEPGPVATTFERRPIGTELALCQRYYLRLQPGVDGRAYGLGYARTGIANYCVIPFPVVMRDAVSGVETTGTATDYGIDQDNGGFKTCNVVPTFLRGGDFNATLNFAIASGSTTSGKCVIATARNANSFLGFSAEL